MNLMYLNSIGISVSTKLMNTRPKIHQSRAVFLLSRITKMTLPPSGIFELPPACSAKTTEWYFPASLDGEDKWEEDNT